MSLPSSGEVAQAPESKHGATPFEESQGGFTILERTEEGLQRSTHPRYKRVFEEAVTAAQDAAEAATATADAAGVAARIEALLTPEGFDRTAVERIIDDAAIPDPQKATLKRLVATAEGNPELLSAALEQVKAVMR